MSFLEKLYAWGHSLVSICSKIDHFVVTNAEFQTQEEEMVFRKHNDIKFPPKEYKYEPLGKLAKILKRLFVAGVVILVLELVVDVWALTAISQLAAGAALSQDVGDFIDVCGGLTGILASLVFLATGIFFLRWFYLLRRNMHALKVAHFDGHPLDVVAGFVIPVINLFRPQYHAQDIWKATDLNFPTDRHWAGAPSSTLIKIWWLFFVLQNIANQVSVQLMIRVSKKEVSLLPFYYLTSAVGDALAIVAAVLAIKVVLALTERQEKFHATWLAGAEQAASTEQASSTETAPHSAAAESAETHSDSISTDEQAS